MAVENRMSSGTLFAAGLALGVGITFAELALLMANFTPLENLLTQINPKYGTDGGFFGLNILANITFGEVTVGGVTLLKRTGQQLLRRPSSRKSL